MSNPEVIILAALPVAFLVIFMIQLRLMLRWYQRVPVGQALVVTKTAGIRQVSFTSALVIGGLWTGEWVDLTDKPIDIQRSGTSADGVPLDVTARLLVGIEATQDAVLAVAERAGAERAGDADVIRERFTPAFEDALVRACATVTAHDAERDRGVLASAIHEQLPDDLGGYAVSDVAVTDVVARMREAAAS